MTQEVFKNYKEDIFNDNDIKIMHRYFDSYILLYCNIYEAIKTSTKIQLALPEHK